LLLEREAVTKPSKFGVNDAVIRILVLMIEPSEGRIVFQMRWLDPTIRKLLTWSVKAWNSEVEVTKVIVYTWLILLNCITSPSKLSGSINVHIKLFSLNGKLFKDRPAWDVDGVYSLKSLLKKSKSIILDWLLSIKTTSFPVKVVNECAKFKPIWVGVMVVSSYYGHTYLKIPDCDDVLSPIIKL
jgi:hypothetical protein